MSHPSIFGQRLKAFRIKEGLSISQLAKESGVPRISISRVESGKQAMLTLDGADRVARVLHILVDDLLRGDRLESDMMAAAV